jgi:hypothetical protein
LAPGVGSRIQFEEVEKFAFNTCTRHLADVDVNADAPVAAVLDAVDVVTRVVFNFSFKRFLNLDTGRICRFGK